MISILDAILAINPDAKVGVENNDVNKITWDQGQTVISKEDIETKKTQLEAEYNANSYQRKISVVRQDRNALLLQTDWMANSDVTMSDAWKTYRQELRDVTEGIDTEEKIENIVWPIKPGE